MRIKVTSDIHGQLNAINAKDCDILLIAGDICPDFRIAGYDAHCEQSMWVTTHFAEWVNDIELSGTKVVIVPGNHDFCFQNNHYGLSLLCDVLIDEVAEVNGLEIYGTPYTPTFYDWAFMEDEDILEKIFSKIPENLDILLSHGPPFGLCDVVNQDINPIGANLGSKALREEIIKKKPKRVFCGHIHTGLHNDVHIGDSVVRNVSLLDERYRVAYKPFEFEL